MTTAIHAFGAQLQRSVDNVTFTEVAEVTSISGPGLALDALDVTAHDAADPWREFIGGLRDGGEVTFDINYVPTNATHGATSGLIDALEDAQLDYYKLILPDSGATTWLFRGLVTAFEPDLPVDEALTASVTIKLSGKPTLV